MEQIREGRFNIYTKEKSPKSFNFLCGEYGLNPMKIEALSVEKTDEREKVFISNKKIDNKWIWEQYQ